MLLDSLISSFQRAISALFWRDAPWIQHDRREHREYPHDHRELYLLLFFQGSERQDCEHGDLHTSDAPRQLRRASSHVRLAGWTRAVLAWLQKRIRWRLQRAAKNLVVALRLAGLRYRSRGKFTTKMCCCLFVVWLDLLVSWIKWVDHHWQNVSIHFVDI